MTILKSLPRGIDLCADLRERAAFYIQFQYLGVHYYIAGTEPVRRLMQLDDSGRHVGPSRSMTDNERPLRDIVAALYLQARDCALTGIAEEVKSTLLKRMDDLMTPTVHKEIAHSIEKKTKRVPEPMLQFDVPAKPAEPNPAISNSQFTDSPLSSATCRYCGQAMTSNHQCEEMRARIAASVAATRQSAGN